MNLISETGAPSASAAFCFAAAVTYFIISDAKL